MGKSAGKRREKKWQENYVVSIDLIDAKQITFGAIRWCFDFNNVKLATAFFSAHQTWGIATETNGCRLGLAMPLYSNLCLYLTRLNGQFCEMMQTQRGAEEPFMAFTKGEKQRNEYTRTQATTQIDIVVSLGWHRTTNRIPLFLTFWLRVEFCISKLKQIA